MKTIPGMANGLKQNSPTCQWWPDRPIILIHNHRLGTPVPQRMWHLHKPTDEATWLRIISWSFKGWRWLIFSIGYQHYFWDRYKMRKSCNIFTISTGKGFLASTSTDQPCWNFVSASPSSASSPGSSCPRCPHRSRSSHIIAASYLYHTIHAWCYCGHSSENLETPESSLRLPQVERTDSWIDRPKTMYILYKYINIQDYIYIYICITILIKSYKAARVVQPFWMWWHVSRIEIIMNPPSGPSVKNDPWVPRKVLLQLKSKYQKRKYQKTRPQFCHWRGRHE